MQHLTRANLNICDFCLHFSQIFLPLRPDSPVRVGAFIYHWLIYFSPPGQGFRRGETSSVEASTWGQLLHSEPRRRLGNVSAALRRLRLPVISELNFKPCAKRSRRAGVFRHLRRIRTGMQTTSSCWHPSVGILRGAAQRQKRSAAASFSLLSASLELSRLLVNEFSRWISLKVEMNGVTDNMFSSCGLLDR